MEAAFDGYSAAQAVRSGGREAVRRALLTARQRTLELADAYGRALAASALRVPYDAARNPPLWELGHIGWFQDWWVARNRQRSRGTGCEPEHDRALSRLLHADAWYDSGRVGHASRWELPLPDAAGTRTYLADGLAQTLELLDRLPQEAGDDDLYFFRLVALHEAMHAEAAVYMARGLGIAVPTGTDACVGIASRIGVSTGAGTGTGTDTNIETAATAAARPEALTLPAQNFQLGHAGPGFAFDNELGAHDIRLDAFEIDAAPVSWSRFASFVAAGGYEDARWWDPTGWAWRLQARSASPMPFLLPLPSSGEAASLDAPATHLSAYEAQAWCRWAGRRLPTEGEWECAALTAPGFRWGQQLGAGGVWEWTASAFQAYPGFAPHPYTDYSMPWFGGRRVLRGASHSTLPMLAHPRYRNFFEPHRTDLFAGFRSCA